MRVCCDVQDEADKLGRAHGRARATGWIGLILANRLGDLTLTARADVAMQQPARGGHMHMPPTGRRPAASLLVRSIRSERCSCYRETTKDRFDRADRDSRARMCMFHGTEGHVAYVAGSRRAEKRMGSHGVSAVAGRQCRMVTGGDTRSSSSKQRMDRGGQLVRGS